MKNIKPETIQAMNKKLGLNYSEDRYSLLEDLKVISITTMDTESTEELSSMYKEKLFKLPLHKNDILNEMENCMDMTVSEMLISLGRKKCLDTYEVNNAVVTVLKKAVLSESKIETYS
ncbi:MAG: hypothetical protein IJ086_15275, partial [Clostridium sp.]|nr:hypothetical protein [Clostridium sp.]